MNKRKIYIIIIIILICLLSFCGYRYYKINKNVPRKYIIDHYSTGENVKLDNVDIKVKSFEKVQRDIESDGDDNIECVLEINIKNTNKNSINLAPLIEESKLSLGVFYQDYCNITGDFKKIKKLLPNEDVNLTFTYTIPKRVIKYSNNKSDFQFYIAKSLYKEQIVEKMKDFKLYGKCVELRVNNEE